LQLIDDSPFQEVSVPKSLVSDDLESIVDFFTEFGLALIDALIKNSPKKVSPWKVLHRIVSLGSVLPDLDTSTKARQENISLGNLSFDKHTIVAADSYTAAKFQLTYAQRHQKCMDAFKQVEQGMLKFFNSLRLTPIELMKSKARSHPFKPSATARGLFGPTIHESLDPEQLEKRMQALHQIDLTRDPYHIPHLKRTDYPYPLLYVAIKGTLNTSLDDNENR